MRRSLSIARFLAPLALGFAVVGATPALAQFSESYVFLKAVRDGDGDKVTKSLRDSGSTMINTRDFSTGEAGLHIVVKRRDMTWINFLLAKGANPNVRDNAGDTPLILAAKIGFIEGETALVENGAAVNQPNNKGETALIIATQQRNLLLVRLLLSKGADAGLPDRIAGKSARDYATEDARASAVLKAIQDAPAVAKPKPKVSGPGL